MNEKLNNYLNSVFSPYEGLHTVEELKDELRKDLQERLEDLKKQGYDDETAYAMTLESIGDIEETIADVAAQSRVLQRKVLTNFSTTNLPNSDFKNVTVHDGKFESSTLKGSDFSGSALSGSSFKCSDLNGVTFDGADC